MAQFSRPDADTTLGNYQDGGGGTTNIWQNIDDNTDGEYIRSPQDPNNEIYVCRMSDITDPGVTSGHVLRARAKTDQASGGNQIDLTVEVRINYVSEGSQGTLIATLTQANISQGSFATYTYNLSAGEAGGLSGNYANIFLRVKCNKV